MNEFTKFILAQVGTLIFVALGFVGNAMYLRGNFGARLENTEEDVKNLKENVRYKDTCEKMHEAIDQRLDRLETVSNGKRR